MVKNPACVPDGCRCTAVQFSLVWRSCSRSIATCGYNGTIPWVAGRSRLWPPHFRSSCCWVFWRSGRATAGKAALAGLLTACAVAFFVFGMPAEMILASAGVGVVFAVFRIVWLILAAVFLYDIVVTTGQFDVMKGSVAKLSADRRLQAVLVAFSFGAFIEGSAGFGAPVAISAAFLVGLGFQPFQAALLCLIANTAPVAWGGIGTPLRTLSAVTGLDVEALSGTSGRILPLLSILIPFWLVRTMTSWRNTLEVWLPLLVIGGTFAVVQFVWSNFVGFELVDIVAAVSSMAGGCHRASPLETQADLAVRPRGGMVHRT